MNHLYLPKKIYDMLKQHKNNIYNLNFLYLNKLIK